MSSGSSAIFRMTLIIILNKKFRHHFSDDFSIECKANIFCLYLVDSTGLLMYTKIFIPTKENHSIDLPKEFFGKEILITVEAVEREIQPPTDEKLVEIENTFNKYRKIDLSNFVFSREEANNFDE